MPFVLIIVGLVLIIVGARAKAGVLFNLVSDDVKTFVPYAAVIIAVGSAGYFSKLRPVANAFLLLVVISLFIGSGRQFFENFSTSLKSLSKSGDKK